MDGLIDFEELIDLQLSLPSVSSSSQEPITDILDKMCEAMDESNLAIDNAFKNEIAPNDDIINLDEFENFLSTTSICNDESYLETDELLEINDMIKIPDDKIDLDECISAKSCLFIDNKDEIDNGNNDISNLQRVLSHEVAMSKKIARGHNTESDVIKEENITSTNNYVQQTIGVESTATSGEKEIENYVYSALEFGTVNPVSSKLKIKAENGSETVRAECKTENIVTFTTYNESEVKYENGIQTSKTERINTIETITEDTDVNINSDSDYDPQDFEFISEQEACKAGIVTGINKVTITENIVALTTNNDSEVKNENGTIETITEDTNENINSDSDYDPQDFEFISKREACKAGIVTGINKVTITENIVALTTNNDSEVKNENRIEISKTERKNTIETITEDTNENINSDSDYDPQDFEFISEKEACKAGIVTGISKTNKTDTNTASSTSKNADNKLQTLQQNSCRQNTSNIDNRPRKNEASLSDYVKYSKYRYQRCYTHSASELHVIPEGERYLDMFRGQYAPGVLNNLYSLTNKRALSAVARAANFEEIANAYRDPGLADEENEKYKDDLDHCSKRILSAYPRENTRKRRRH